MKVKSMLVGNEQPTPPFNWDVPRLYSNQEGDKVILSTGYHDNNTFSGTVIFNTQKENSKHSLGYFSHKWDKSSFIPLPPNRQITLQNSND
jgi:hypothetical protein